MNTAQKIHYIQSEHDAWDRNQCMVTNLQLATLNDFKTLGFVGDLFVESKQVKVTDVIYEAVSVSESDLPADERKKGLLTVEKTVELFTAMFMAPDEQAFRDASYAALNVLNDLFEDKAYQIALGEE